MARELIARIRGGKLLAPRSATTDENALTKFGTVRPEWVNDLEQEDARSPLRRLVIAGILTILISFGGFFGWAASAELESATVVTGTVMVDSKRKTISHLEGGILDRLLVQEGDEVKVGQPLVRLDDTKARSDLRSLQSHQTGLIAKLARLHAEQAGASEITFPENFVGANDVLTDSAIKAEQIFFLKRNTQKKSRLDVQEKLVEQYSEQVKASTAQIAAVEREIELYKEQRIAIASLVNQGYAQKSQLTDIDARLSGFAATLGEYGGDKARAEQAEAGARFSLTGIESDVQSEIAGEITTTLTDLADTEERIVGAKDVMRRVEVRSPQAGIVDNIRLRTPGSVVRAGEAILDIVPENEPLIIEVKINPRDIEDVAVNSKVQVHLTAYNQRTLLPLDGRVTYVAADQLPDEKTGEAYFIARAEIAPQSLAANPTVKLYPGMPADMIIVHKSRKALQYIVGPIWESFNHAFRED